jgi:hypothetical protein
LSRNSETAITGSDPARIRFSESIDKAAALHLPNRMPHANSFSYFAYGVNIESEILLPDLMSAEAEPDVRIRHGEIATSPLFKSLPENAEVFERPGCRIVAALGAMCISWEKVGTFLVHGGTDVIVEREPNVPVEDLQPFLTGPVLSVLLHQRGLFVLHASSVVIGGVAVAFLGAKGDGKSTLAAHLQVRGHRLIGDDIVPVNLENGSPVVVSGFPRIKLYNDSIVAVGHEPSDFPLIHRFVEKRSFQYSDAFSTEPVPLHSLYILSEGAEVGLEKLGHASTFIEITRHTYVNRYLKALGAESEHFEHCRKLIQKLPVWKLNRPRDFEAMDDVCKLLENNVRRDVTD